MASIRRLALVLMAMLARPWVWLMLGAWGLWPVLLLFTHLLTPSLTLSSVAVVPSPTVPPNGGADIRPDQLATITDWHALWTPQFSMTAAGERTLVESERDRSERLGDWDILDRLPALEQLWMTAPDVLSTEGWRRIGDHKRLELLSLTHVGSASALSNASFARDGRDALARLTRLTHLELHGTGSERGILLPPLPALQVCSLEWKHLEENLTTLAAGSPRLQVLALDTYPQFEFTPGMLAALRQMPALHTIYVAAAVRPRDEPAMARQVAELGRAIPKMHVRPGSYSEKRVKAVGAAAFAHAFLCWVVWFQAATLLATPLGWMLPRRIPPHVVWPIAVAAAGSAALLILCRSFGVAWLPAVGLALFASGVGLYGPVIDDTPGWPTRLTHAAIGADYAGGLLIGGTFIWPAATADRWLMGYEPVAALVLVVVAAASLGWKIARVVRLPRILAEGGREAAVVWTLASGQAGSRAPTTPSGQSDQRWWLPDVAIDRQLAQPLPTAKAAATRFADLLRRPLSRRQVPLMMGFMLVAGSLMAALPWIRGGNASTFSPRGWSAMVAVQFAWQAVPLSLAMTASLWWQRRGSLVLDFLRPVSRTDYWLGLRRAIASDLILPLAVVASGLVMAASWWSQGHLLPWIVSGLGFGGVVAAVPAMLLVIATGRRSLIATTIAAGVLLVVAGGLAAAVGEAFFHVWYGGSVRSWRAIAGAIIVLVAGLAIRGGVLRRLTDQEIG
ncbi:MAG: hypothetical protein RLZZ440_2207 [Planctomycetota bacterium]